MPIADTKLERQLYAALKRIAGYQSPASLHRYAERDYVVGGSEAIEMAYENVIQEAKNALKGVRLRKAPP
jgi:hypothetical protein